MPWKETRVVDERIAFMKRLHAGERMSDLCREYGISRKTGYKFQARYEQLAGPGMADQSRAPSHIPHRTHETIVGWIRELRLKQPTWGPKKLKAVLEREQQGVRIPAVSTIGDILVREGLCARRKRRRRPTRLTADKLRKSERPNEVWCIDFKGEFRLGNGRLCYPLTLTDHYSRYYLGLDALDGTKDGPAMESVARVFEAHGLPEAIRSDNGVPFATRSVAGLSRMSVWWMKLGIVPERIEPGKPQQNGRHERSHLTLKRETTRPAAKTALQQQERFDTWLETYNHVRPHESLDQTTPVTLYKASKRKLPSKLPDYDYALCDDVATVNRSGAVTLSRRRHFFLGAPLAGERVGLCELEDDVWRVDFLTMNLGHFNARSSEFTFNPNPTYAPTY